MQEGDEIRSRAGGGTGLSQHVHAEAIATSTIIWIDPGRLVPSDERAVLVMLARDWLQGVPAPAFLSCEARAYRTPSDPAQGVDISDLRWVDASEQELHGVVAWAEMPQTARATRAQGGA